MTARTLIIGSGPCASNVASELLASGIDISIVAEGMEMFGSASMLYPRLTTDDMIMANAVVIVLGVVASLSPAWRASRYEPIEAISKV